MKKSIKIMSLILTFSLLISEQQKNIQELYEILPEDTEITFKNGIYHIVTSDPTALYEQFAAENGLEASSVTRGAINYSATGGSYTKFGTPPVPNTDWPYSQVYLPKDYAHTLLDALQEPTFASTVKSWVEGQLTEQAITLAAKEIFGVVIPKPAQVFISFIVTIAFYVVNVYDAKSLKSAIGRSAESKVCITNMAMGHSAYIVYTPWEGTACPAYGGITTATWTAGNYNGLI